MSDLFHISAADLNRYHLDAITGPELALIEEHLLSCFICHNRAEENLRSIQHYGRAHLGHITTDDLELYQLGRMTDTQAIAVIDNHLSECIDCAHRMLAFERFIKLVRQGVVRDDFDIRS